MKSKGITSLKKGKTLNNIKFELKKSILQKHVNMNMNIIYQQKRMELQLNQ